MEIKLTEYSHGSGCGCKISPEVLDAMLQSVKTDQSHPELLVGNDQKDDAAVLSIDEERAIISTTDFFMPIVDDPYDFGRIAATNAISDIYAMGGKPIMAISIFGWPIDKLPKEVGQKVIEGGRKVCEEAGIPLAGGHSIDSPEPIFGLAVTGIVKKANLRKNNGAQPGDHLYLTKPLGIGILTTAEKRKILNPQDAGVATALMLQSNKIGAELAENEMVTAITDVTGFGLAGHLSEICQASNVSAEIDFKNLPVIEGLDKYLRQACKPGGTEKNFNTYKDLLSEVTDYQRDILFDPQTSGGLLLSVKEEGAEATEALLQNRNLPSKPIGVVHELKDKLITVF